MPEQHAPCQLRLSRLPIALPSQGQALPCSACCFHHHQQPAASAQVAGSTVRPDGAGNLQELELGGGYRLTSRPLAALRRGLPRLRRLYLSGARLRGHDGLVPPAAWDCQPLERLTLER